MNGIETGTIVPASSARAAKPAPRSMSSDQYNVALGYLRAFITSLVIVHHAVLAYHPYAPTPSPNFSSQPLMWTAFPIVDSQRLAWRRPAHRLHQ